MKRIFSILLFVFLIPSVYAINETDSLIKELDKALENSQPYVIARENRIKELKATLHKPGILPEEIYHIQQQLYQEYHAFMCDSALYYLDENLDIAQNLKRRDWICDIQLRLTYLLSSSGMYKEAADMLDSIDRKNLPDYLQTEYYKCIDHVYGELNFYTQDKRSALRYSKIARNYKDSLFSKADPESELYLSMKEMMLRDSGKLDEAEQINIKRLSHATFATPDYALITFHRYLIYEKRKDVNNQKKYLILSAISDIKSAIKDNASLCLLANLLYEDGEIDKAYRYIRHSLDDANFYNAKLRNIQVSNIQPIIDKAYQLSSERQKDKMRFSLILISILAVFSIIAIYYIYRQVNTLAKARNELENANQKLNALNQDLHSINKQLEQLNSTLGESNHIKEEYIGLFLSMCSTYIDKIENFRKMVNKKISSSQIPELLKYTQSSELTESELRDFYTHFDNTFLHLYPNFVDEFNALLVPTEKIELKKGELLNTELRIFALIRLGITDSSKIAELLRYSVNTIYNYRAKIKNKAIVPRDNFEEYVIHIGTPTRQAD